MPLRCLAIAPCLKLQSGTCFTGQILGPRQPLDSRWTHLDLDFLSDLKRFGPRLLRELIKQHQGWKSWCLSFGFYFWSYLDVLLSQNNVFGASPRKTMQNHLEIISKTKSWTQIVRKYSKTLTSVMSGLALEDKSLSAKQAFLFSSFQKLYFSDFY